MVTLALDAPIQMNNIIMTNAANVTPVIVKNALLRESSYQNWIVPLVARIIAETTRYDPQTITLPQAIL